MADAPLPVIIGMAIVAVPRFFVDSLNAELYPTTIKQPLLTITSTAIFCGICSFAFPRDSLAMKCFTLIVFPITVACLTVIVIARKKFQFYHALKNDRDALLAELRKNGLMLKYGPKFNKDHDIVLEAVRQNGLALADADAAMQNDEEIVETAFRSNASSLIDASESLRNDKKFILKLAKINKHALYCAGDQLWKSEEFLLGAVVIDAYVVLNHRRFWGSKYSTAQSDKVFLAALEANPNVISLILFNKLSELDFLEELVTTNDHFSNFDWDPYISKEIQIQLEERLEMRSRTSMKSSAKMLPSDS